MKRVLGLDLGTNSIGWALVDTDEKKILGMGSRIIPMSQEVLGKFDSGNSISQTAMDRYIQLVVELFIMSKIQFFESYSQ